MFSPSQKDVRRGVRDWAQNTPQNTQKMASAFVKTLKEKLSKHVDHPIKVVNSPKTDYDEDNNVVICYGKKFTKDLRIKNDQVHKTVTSRGYTNEHCVFVFTTNLMEVMDFTKMNLEDSEYPAKLGRWISSYGFKRRASCTVCYEEFNHKDMVICEECQAAVCIGCFARCVRTKVAPTENIPNVFKCPTCCKSRFTYGMLDNLITSRMTSKEYNCPWDVLDNTIAEEEFECPQVFVTHPTHPFDYVGYLEMNDDDVVEIMTENLQCVLNMMKTEGAFVCVGDIPHLCACGSETCTKDGKSIDVTNGRAFVFRNGVFTEVEDGFPIVLSCFYTG